MLQQFKENRSKITQFRPTCSGVANRAGKNLGFKKKI